MRVARAQIGASTLKKTQTHLKRVIVPSEVDRAAISRALERILELSEKHLAGEQLSSLARGRPAGLRWCSCRSRRGVGAQTNRKPPTKARKLESRPDFTGEAIECASAMAALGFRVSAGVSLNHKTTSKKQAEANTTRELPFQPSHKTGDSPIS